MFILLKYNQVTVYYEQQKLTTQIMDSLADNIKDAEHTKKDK